jgi:hypothetical protein
MSAELRPAARAAAVVAALLPLVLAALWLRAPEAQQQPAEYVAPEISDTGSLKGPRQPIFFRHDVHAGQYQMDCRYCHSAVEVSSNPGLPSMETCLGCHRITGAALPEVQKLREAAGTGQAIQWVKVHNLPQFVRFPHMRHVRAQIACQTCHGPVERMPQVYQWAPLKMGWCLDCHNQRQVTTDCTACHY